MSPRKPAARAKGAGPAGPRPGRRKSRRDRAGWERPATVVPTDEAAPLPLDVLARRHVRKLARRAPGLLPRAPLKPSEVAEPLTVASPALTELLRSALTPAGQGSVVWQERGAEVIAHFGRTRVRVLDGLIIVGVTLESEQTGAVELTVPFAVGARDLQAGMVAAAERRPRGPAVLVDTWGEAVLATAWKAVAEVAGRLAAQAGLDQDGTPLIPGGLVARDGVLELVPQARHAFDRSRRP